MKNAQGKTVTIFSGDPPTENGPCTTTQEEDVSEDTIHEVAAKVVENVVRLASQATQGNYSPQSSSVNHAAHDTTSSEKQQQASSEISSGPCLMRLPTFQIDTVPSMPPSPDWSPPPEEYSFQEEALDEAEIEIQFGATTEEASEEIKKFAATYVQDLISKAMTIAEEKQVSEDTAKAQDVAAQVVDDVIAKATETANERLQQPSVVTPPETLEFPIKFAQAPEEMKEFAASYVKEIITKAISMAEEKFVPTVPFNFEDVNLMKASGPWYIRAREALMRLLRTACFCTPRRNES